ncbi:MAG: rod shape-determining protein MreD [Dysgonamonadaceae bacterium]|nr:rod shape-determining protein MreD [Dysgonamonadaceae bacterium]
MLKTGLVFVFFAALQVLILNNIHFFRIAIPFLYIYVILKMPIDTGRIQLVLISFLLGLIIDLFSNTMGMHAAACSLIGFVREPLLTLLDDKDMVKGASPSYYTMSTGAFMRYVLFIVVLHHVTLFLIESISLFDPLFLLLRIFSCVILTSLCIFIVEVFNVNRKSGES